MNYFNLSRNIWLITQAIDFGMDDQGLPIYLIWLLGKQLENVDSCPAQSLDMVFMFGHWLLSKRFQIPSVPSFLSRH